MTIWQNFITILLMSGVFALALLFASSDDLRDRTLAWIVMIVYISIGAYHVYRLTRRTKSS